MFAVTSLLLGRRSLFGMALVLLAGVSERPSAAQEDSKWYAGAGLNVADYRGDHEGVSYEDTPMGAQLYGGVRLRDRLAVELAFTRLFDIESGDIPGSGVQRLNVSAEYEAITVRGVFSVALADILPRRTDLTVFGTAGVYTSDEQRRVNELVSSRITTVSASDSGPVLGAGVIYKVFGVNLRTYVERVGSGDTGRWDMGIAAEFRF